jgi:Coenzyme PQQ synthesis protein D (PqqD)
VSVLRPVRDEKLITRIALGETCIVPIRNNIAQFEFAFVLKGSAPFLWSQLDGTRDAAALTALVRAKFAIPDDRDVRADVDQFLDELARRGLIHEAPTPTGAP